ncbi:hypothetical protein GGR28_002024 [Lewinella aquimaris]|uniref:DUF3347 domain-containing protein n=1 Tax=Neolewinella aquimaris TaxID=1835722 RepID=A0A840E1I2_9BACT|nr:DUF3347 domain-containing protein [Neolewinella aquimaris]MBB4079404.1 hypothetical protein [Neolewinella aquimaris]
MTYKLLTSLLLPAFLFASCGGNAQTENATETGLSTPAEVEAQQESAPEIADTEFGDPITDKVFQNYLHLRTALVNSDAGEASKVAFEMTTTLENERPELRTIAQRIADTNDLTEQRIAFAELTTAAESLFTEGITGGKFYKLHCPMAMDGAGADWFSEVDEVRNPFYGDKMLKCGSVTGEITQ